MGSAPRIHPHLRLLPPVLVCSTVMLTSELAARERVRCFLLAAPFDHVVTEMGRRENEERIYRALRVAVVDRTVSPRRVLPLLDVTRDASLLLSLPRRNVLIQCKEEVKLEEDRFIIRGYLHQCHWKVRYFQFQIEVTKAGNCTKVVTRLELLLNGLGRRLVERWGPKIVLKDLECTIRCFTGGWDS